MQLNEGYTGREGKVETQNFVTTYAWKCFQMNILYMEYYMKLVGDEKGQ